MYWVILLLLVLLFFHWKKEGYENYDASCISLAKKNQANLDSLKKEVDKILELQTKVQTLQSTNDTNKTQLKNLVDQVYKT